MVVNAALGQNPTAVHLKRLLAMINHRLDASRDELTTRDLLLLIAELLARMMNVQLPQSDTVVEYLWQVAGIAKYARMALSSTILPGALIVDEDGE